LVKGDKEESLVVVLFTHLIFLFILPAIIYFYSIFLGEIIDFLKILKLIIIFLLLPITLAYFIQKTKISNFIKNNPLINNLLFLLLLIIIFSVVSLNSSKLSKNPLDYVLEIILICFYFAIYFLIIRLLFKEKEERKTLLLSLTYKNYVLTFVLLSNFSKKFLILPVVYVVLANIFLYFYLYYFEEKEKF